MEKHKEHHIVNYSTFIFIWIALVIFTGITVTVAGMKLGLFSILTALLIASIKTSLVLYYFMHLKYEAMVFKIMFFVAIGTLTVFIGITFVDVLFR
jgi:cytochrome c oxidase subunit IV